MVSVRDIRENGVIAKLFLPNTSEPRHAIIVLHGSCGGFYETVAQIFAQEGYVALALAYFNADGAPKNLENIPLEYFLNAIRWLRIQPCVKSKQIHLYGVSRGGELAVLLASTFPNEISSIVAVVPSSVTYGGVPNEEMPSWTLNGNPLPIAPSPSREDEYKQLETRKSVNLTKLFLGKMYNNKEDFNKAMINVENTRSPMLLISGKDDKIWPSSLYCDLIMQRLNACNSRIIREHLSYDNVGHMILHSLAPVMTEPQQHPVIGLLYEVGGNPIAQASANKDSWGKILHFFANFSQEFR